MSLSVPILRVPFSDEDRKFIHEGIDEILASGQFVLGANTDRFERMFAEFSGASHAVACTNGTSALELILRGLGIEGKSVIVPTNTFLATALAVMHAGNRVIFADSDPKTLSLDVEDVARRIEADTAAVMLVHIGGVITPAIYQMQKLCKERNLVLIEDCAHAHGCSIDGHMAGTLGVAGGFSFFPTKVLTTAEGGVVTTNDAELAKRMKMIRNQGKNPEQGNRMSEFGHNFRLSEITALVGVQQMLKAQAIVNERRRIAAFYDRRLKDIPWIEPLNLLDGQFSSYYKYVAYLDEGIERARVKTKLKQTYGVSLTGEVYSELCHTEPLWETFTYCGKRRTGEEVACNRWPECGCNKAQSDFPGAEYISRHHVCLPVYPGLSHEQLEHVAASLESVLAAEKESR